MYDVTDATTSLGTLFTDAGTIIGVVIAAILVGLVALVGLGYGVRLLKKHITGKKF